jgi:uncharacterized membrane protein
MTKEEAEGRGLLGGWWIHPLLLPLLLLLMVVVMVVIMMAVTRG